MPLREISIAFVMLISPGFTAGDVAHHATPGRLQEGPFSHHFDGNTNGPELRAEDQSRCVATTDVFSGRPNPTWRLSAAASRRAWTRIRSGRAAAPARREVRVPGLGYRGVILLCGSALRPGSVRILCGDVLASGDPRPLAYAPDLDRALLLQSGGRTRWGFQRAYGRTCERRAS